MHRTGASALAAALDRQAEADRRDRLHAQLHQWGDYQREGYEQPGIDYARPRVVGNAPGSKFPAPEWYIVLVGVISCLSPADQAALRRAYVEGDGKAGGVFEDLLDLGLGEG